MGDHNPPPLPASSRKRPKTSKPLIIGMVLGGAVVAYLFATRGYGWLYHGPFTPPLRRFTESNYASTHARAQALVAALEACKQDRGEYPAALSELAPRYIPVFEPLLVGHGRWEYSRVSADRFRLKFLIGPLYENDFYDSAVGEWRVDR